MHSRPMGRATDVPVPAWLVAMFVRVPSAGVPWARRRELLGWWSMTSFWPTRDHWSVPIPRNTPHPRLDVLADTGCVRLPDLAQSIPPDEWESLDYMD